MKNSRRTVVLDGTFSIEEIEVTATTGRKATKPSRKKAVPKKKATAKKSVSRKRAKKSGKNEKPEVAGPSSVVLDDRPGIKNILELKEQLTTAFDAGGTVVVDAHNVESIDTTALQLLVAFANSVHKQSRTLQWVEPSGVFREMADLADLSRCLGVGDCTVAEDIDDLCPVF